MRPPRAFLTPWFVKSRQFIYCLPSVCTNVCSGWHGGRGSTSMSLVLDLIISSGGRINIPNNRLVIMSSHSDNDMYRV